MVGEELRCFSANNEVPFWGLVTGINQTWLGREDDHANCFSHDAWSDVILTRQRNQHILQVTKEVDCNGQLVENSNVRQLWNHLFCQYVLHYSWHNWRTLIQISHLLFTPLGFPLVLSPLKFSMSMMMWPSACLDAQFLCQNFFREFISDSQNMNQPLMEHDNFRDFVQLIFKTSRRHFEILRLKLIDPKTIQWNITQNDSKSRCNQTSKHLHFVFFCLKPPGYFCLCFRKLRPVDEGTELEHQMEVPVLRGRSYCTACVLGSSIVRTVRITPMKKSQGMGIWKGCEKPHWGLTEDSG